MNDRDDPIFSGRIEHFSNMPGGLAVDWFKDDDIKNLYFISHAHGDHIPGLCTRNFSKLLKSRPHAIIYCTEITKEIILRLPRVEQAFKEEFEKHHESLPLNGTTDIVICDENGNPTLDKMSVRTIPANHIPGAVMFLFEDGKKRALYTGDFRYDVREKTAEMRALKNFVETYEYDEVIDYLYVDVTCLDLGRLFHPDQNKLPSRPEITEIVIKLINDEKPSSVHIDASPLGAEVMVKSLAKSLNNSADSILDRLADDCSGKELYRYMLSTKATCSMETTYSTEATSETDIHVLNGSIFKTTCKKCDKDTLKIRATLGWLFSPPSKKYCSDQNTWRNKLEDKDFLQVLYSHHSSDTELREFLSRLKFKEVFPICKPFSRNNFEEIYIDPEISSVEEKSLYLSLDHPSPTYSEKSHVFWLTRVNQDQANLPKLPDDKFWVTVKDFENSDGILSAVKHCDQPINFIVIHCTIKLQRSLGKLYCNLFRFIKTLKKEISTKSKDSNDAAQKETIDTVLFYSTTNNMNDQWKQIINSIRLYRNKDVPKVFYIDLTTVPEYKKKPRYDIESRIIKETLKNLIRNKDKEVFVSDWPMPYEFSERKREYEQENSDLGNVRENKRVKCDIENMERGG